MVAASEIDLNAPATLVVAWRSGRNADGRVIRAGGDVSEALRSYARDALAAVATGEGRPYDPNNEQEDEVAYLEADRTELLDTALLHILDTGASLRLASPDDLRGRSLALYALLVGPDPGSRIAFVRRGSPVKLARKGLLVAVLGDQTLVRVSDPLFAFDSQFDVIITPGDVWILDQRNFELLFKESEAVLAKAPEWVEQLSRALPIVEEGKEWLASRLKQNSVLRRKVHGILRSSYLAKLTPEIMQYRMIGHGLDPGKLMQDGQLVFNKDTENDILLFLNEDLWTGDFSGEEYAAMRKTRRI